jgi:hypothetical protein
MVQYFIAVPDDVNLGSDFIAYTTNELMFIEYAAYCKKAFRELHTITIETDTDNISELYDTVKKLLDYTMTSNNELDVVLTEYPEICTYLPQGIIQDYNIDTMYDQFNKLMQSILSSVINLSLMMKYVKGSTDIFDTLVNLIMNQYVKMVVLLEHYTCVDAIDDDEYPMLVNFIRNTLLEKGLDPSLLDGFGLYDILDDGMMVYMDAYRGLEGN